MIVLVWLVGLGYIFACSVVLLYLYAYLKFQYVEHIRVVVLSVHHNCQI